MKLKALTMVLVIAMMVSCFAACGKEPAESDPLTSDVTTTGDVDATTTTAADNSTVTGDDTTTAADDTPTTATGSSDNKPTADSNKTTGTTKKKTDKPPANYDITTAPLPKRTLTNKNLTYFYWGDLETGAKDWNVLMSKQYGVKFSVKKANFSNYWNTLAMLIRSGESPDIIEMPAWDFYPRAITMDVLQPLDDILDLNDGLWNETRDIMEKYKWKGQTYLTFLKADMYSWFYYNEKMMKNYGVKKTPKELFLEDNWTLEECYKIMEKFATKDGSKWGLTVQNCDLQAITGVNLVDYDATAGYKLNMKDPKIAQLMNWIYSVGVGGNNTMQCNDPVGDFGSEKCAMIITTTSLLSSERAQKIREHIEWVPMPKLDKSSSYYLEMNEAPNLAIAKGAKNVEGAALALEFRRWLYLGRVQTSDFLPPKTNAAVKKYKISVASNYDHLDKDEVAWTEEVLKKYDYKYADISWGSWVNTTGHWSSYPGYYEVLREGKSWSSLVETEYNKLNALLKAMCS
ncbi:MAG: hypothetical protein IJ518_02945 [Clostridia bacterium]|nr:hypothetical protein [Clostridia bacterium]